MNKDKVATVRIEFANSLIVIKPQCDYDSALVNEILSILTQMHMDPDRDVVEAVENCDF
jgi:hypothetical protein